MTQPPEELRWRIEQMEEERGLIERLAMVEKDPAMETLVGELYQGIDMLISDLYATANTQSKTSRIYPKR